MHNRRMSRTVDMTELLRQIENCEEQKSAIRAVVRETQARYDNGKLTRRQHAAELHRKLGGRTSEKLHRYYDDCIAHYTQQIEASERETKQRTSFAPFTIALLIALLLGLGIYLGPGITGAAILDTGAILNTNSTFDLGENVTSLRVTGMFSGSGHGIMYLNDRIVIDTALLNSTSFTDICVDTCADINGANLTAVIDGELTFIITQFNYTTIISGTTPEQLVTINNTLEHTNETLANGTNETPIGEIWNGAIDNLTNATDGNATNLTLDITVDRAAGRSLNAKHYGADEKPVFTFRVTPQARAVGIAANSPVNK